MANKFNGLWKSELNSQRDGRFRIRDGSSADRVIVRKPHDGSSSDDTDGNTSGDDIEFTSKGRRYWGTITINDDPDTRDVIEATINGKSRRVLPPSPEAARSAKQKHASQESLTGDDDWVATRPPGN